MRKRILLFSLVVIVLSGCGGRNTSTLPKALLGHWVVHGDTQETHYYVDSEKLTMVDGSRRMEMAYRVLEMNENENWIKIRVKTGYDVGHDKRLQFSSDRRSLTSTIKQYEEHEYSIPSKWIYVDDKHKSED
jgi:hypothetical protein